VSLETILLTAIVLFGLPTWATFFRRKRPSRLSLWAFILIAFAELLQLVFVVGLALHLFLLYYSTYFAIIGLPFGVAGAVIGMISLSKTRSDIGYIVTGAFTIVCWMFLITLH
jgi:hypothetical protein